MSPYNTVFRPKSPHVPANTTYRNLIPYNDCGCWTSTVIDGGKCPDSACTATAAPPPVEEKKAGAS